jgi:hypothetical protein
MYMLQCVPKHQEVFSQIVKRLGETTKLAGLGMILPYGSVDEQSIVEFIDYQNYLAKPVNNASVMVVGLKYFLGWTKKVKSEVVGKDNTSLLDLIAGKIHSFQFCTGSSDNGRFVITLACTIGPGGDDRNY